jgi:cytosine permease
MSTTPETPVTPAVPAPVAAPLPDYIQAARPNPPTNRAPWYLNTAPTYAGIFLWFVFWDKIPYLGGMERGGLGMALLGVLLGGLICHFFFYLIPALIGMKTGLPLYIVGTSTFGAVGGLAMPGFLMGVLQFGWLAVNAFASAGALLSGDVNNPLFYPLCVAWVLLAAFIGLKGIQYVAKVATFLPIIPLAVLLLGLVQFGGSAAAYRPTVGQAEENVGLMTILAMAGYIVGFFATAGAAGVDFGMNNRDRRDVQWGGLIGIFIATLVTAGFACIIVAGAQMEGILTGGDEASMTATNSLKRHNENIYPALMFGLALAAFPGACFSSFIAANSFKTVMPRVNPFVSVGIGALVSILLAVTKVAGDLASVFEIIGASFGPICGAMCIDYILAGNRWSGPRAGFNPAGWIAWLLGFIVGIAPTVARYAAIHGWPVVIPEVPAAPIVAFLVGALVYYILAKIGLQSPILPYAPAAEQKPA